MCICLTTVAYAYNTALDGEGYYVINRGVFGVAYKAVTTVMKVAESILFGRYGVRGLTDYFRVDKYFLEQGPKY